MTKVELGLGSKKIWRKLMISLIYGFCLSIALNLFWVPGHISAGGVTGVAQVIAIIFRRYLNFSIGGLAVTDVMNTANLIFIINVPLIWISWRDIGREFTVFTLITVVSSSVLINLTSGLNPLVRDPMICAIFGAVINGAGIGLALRNGLSSGGTDIVGMVLHKYFNISVGTVSIAVNACVVIVTGFLEGWPHALYSVIAIFIGGKAMDLLYTRQQRLQVMIVTNQSKANEILTAIHKEMRHGITVFKDTEGGYKHESKTVLLTIISRAEFADLQATVRSKDSRAFISSTRVAEMAGAFVEPSVD
jgi:uncharacterized membrane-anchored protein YitT (DUF2179 family)